MKKVQIFLLILIIIGVILLLTQKIWVPKLVERIISQESNLSDESSAKVFSPGNEYYALEKYVKSEWVTCCGNDEPFEKKIYSVSIFESDTNKLIKEFTEFNYDGYQGYTPQIYKWYSNDILQMSGLGIIDAFSAFYDISADKLLPEWEFNVAN